MSFFDVASSLGAWDYLRFGDASGTVAQDSTANNRDGTYVGCTLGQPGLLTGQAGTSVRLDGVDDRITLPAPIYSPAHTVVFLMRSSDVQTTQAIYHEGNSGTDTPMWMLASDGVRESPSHLRVYVRGDDNVALLSTTLGSGINSVSPVHDGQTHLIIWEDAISSTNTSQRAYKLHIDDATGNNPQRSGTYAVSTITLNRATWGAWGRTAYADFWAGTLQEAIRLKRILTVSEKQRLFAELRAPSIGLPTKRVWIRSQNAWIAKPIRRWIPAEQKWEGNVVIPPEEPPEEPPPATAATVSLWAASAGSDDPRRVNIAAKINTASLSCRAVVSVTENLATPVFSPPATADSQGSVKLSITDLTPATNYWYALEIAGGLDANKKGMFRTAPNKVATSFSFTFHNCAEFDSNAVIYDTITADAAALHIITDDISYWHEKPGVPDPMLVADFRNQFDAVLAQVRPAALWASRNVYTAMGDHSYGVDGGNSTMVTKNAAQQVFQEKVPHPTLPIAGSINYSFGWGQVLFIVIDDRANRSGATMLGTNQKAWLKSQLSRNDYKLKILVTPSVWNADSTWTDDWGGFITERNELRDYMNVSGFGQLAILSGSMHGLAYGDGSSANSGGFAEYHGGSIDKAASSKGGPWISSSTGTGKYGRISVTDTGTAISLGFSGKTGSVSTITSTKTYTYTSADRWQALLNEHVGFGTLTIPSGTFTITNTGTGTGSLSDAASQPNRKVTVAPGLSGEIRLGGALDLPSNWWLDGSDGNIILVEEGLNIPGNNTVVAHIRGEANGPNDSAPDFIGVKASGRNFWLHHLTGVGGGDNVGDGCIDVADGGANGTISWCRIENWNKCHSLNDGSTNITMHHNLWRGNWSRQPKCTNGCFCHFFNNWVDSPNSYGSASTNDGRFLIENNIYEGSNANVRCIGILGDAPGFVRNAGGNLLLSGGSIQTNGPGNVPNPPYSYTLAPANQALMDLLEAEAGWQPR